MPATGTRIRTGLGSLGTFMGTSGQTLRFTFRRPFQFRELVEQFWFMVSVSVFPAGLAAVPVVVISFYELTLLLSAVGAKDLAGAGTGLAVVRETSPIITVLVLSGASATALCADLGARTIREEIDAMQVMGVNPIQRLVVPRVLAITVVALLLNGFISVVSIATGYATAVFLQGVSPGLWADNLTLLVGPIDFVSSEVKAGLFGLIAGLVASHLGLRVKGGARGVADAVMMTVVLSFLLLFFANSVLSSVFIQLKG